MLGVFDSGVGGLTVLKSIHERLPDLSTLYLGDGARVPYGAHDAETIYRWTLEGVRFLLDAGCPLVILACNTASAVALRKMQQEVLSLEYPGRRVIGIVRPFGEYLSAQSYQHVGLLATPATVTFGYYVDMMRELDPSLRLTQVGCPGLVEKIERTEAGDEETQGIVEECVQELLAVRSDLDAVVLACTHYPLIEDLFRAAIPKDIPLLTQGNIVANSLVAYLRRHPELLLDRTGQRRYLTTGDDSVSDAVSRFYGRPIIFEHVKL